MPAPEWVGRNEYPQDKDMDTYGEDAPWDDDPLTIGYVGNNRPRFWTPWRIGVAVIMLMLLATIVLPLIAPLLR